METKILVDNDMHVIPDDITDYNQHIPAMDCWCVPIKEYDPSTPHLVIYVHLSSEKSTDNGKGN